MVLEAAKALDAECLQVHVFSCFLVVKLVPLQSCFS